MVHLDELSDTRVSVIIPCRNQGRYLRRALQSVFSQTLLPSEVIVVNDDSSDNTADVVHDFDVIYVECRARSGHRARTLGLEQATGNVVVLLDADNELFPPFVERHLSELVKNPGVAWCYSVPYIYREPRQDVGWYPYDEGVARGFEFSEERLAVFNYIDMCSVIRRQALEAVGEVFPGPNPDYALWLALTERGWKGKLIDEPLFLYRIHSENQSRRLGRYSARSALPRPDMPIVDAVPEELRDRHQRSHPFWNRYRNAGAVHCWWARPRVDGSLVALRLFASPLTEETVYRARFVVDVGSTSLAVRECRPINTDSAQAWGIGGKYGGRSDGRFVVGLPEVPSMSDSGSAVGIEILCELGDGSPLRMISAIPWWVGTQGVNRGPECCLSLDGFT